MASTSYRPSNTRFALRLIAVVLLSSAYYTALPGMMQGWLRPGAYEGFIGTWKALYAPLLIVYAAVAVYLAFCRRHPLGYMKWYKRQAMANTYSSCPRCGAVMEEKVGKESYQARTGTKITTTKWSDGSTSQSEEAIYSTKTQDYIYFQCTNSACKLKDDHLEPTKWMSYMPWKKKEIRFLTDVNAPAPSSTHVAEYTLQLRLLCPIICLLTVGFIVISTMSFNHYCRTGNYTVEEALEGNGQTLVQQVLDAENEATNWQVSVDKLTLDYGKYMTFQAEKGASVKRYLQSDGTEVLNFKFDGYDLDTGLQGEYDIVTLNGELSLVDCKAEVAYQKGSAFFDENYPKLKALTYDALLKPTAEQAVGGDYGKNKSYGQILRKGETVLAVWDERRTEMITQEGNVRTRFVTDVTNEEYTHTYEMGNTKIDGESQDVSNLDELGKLLAKADYTVYIDVFNGDSQVGDIEYEKNLNEHSFHFQNPYGDFKRGTYRIIEGEDAFTLRTYDEDWITSEDITYSVSKDKALYDQLMAMVPETYTRKVFDFEKAKKTNLVIAQQYTMKDENGNKVELLVTLGKLDKLTHYTSEKDYIEFGWM